LCSFCKSWETIKSAKVVLIYLLSGGIKNKIYFKKVTLPFQFTNIQAVFFPDHPLKVISRQ